MAERSNLSFDSLRRSLSRSDDPNATLDMGRAQRMGGVFWLLGGAGALLLLPFAPPDALGWPGWLIAGLGILSCFAIAWRRFDTTLIPNLDEIYLAGWVGLSAIAAIEWLAGGRSSPYHHLYLLPALYTAAVHSTRRALTFLAAVTLAVSAPLLYEGGSQAVVVDVVAQGAILVALALMARVLLIMGRSQQGQLRRAGEQAEARARRDALTGLGNRLAFQEAIAREVARAERSGTPLTVLLGDLKDFKSINDNFGHTRGDECLRTAAETLAKAARASDECFRWGGDEFAVLLPETSQEEGAHVRDRISNLISARCPTPTGQPQELVCAATSRREGQGPEELMVEVDRALTHLKASGRR